MLYLTQKQAQEMGCVFKFYARYQHVSVPVKVASGSDLALRYGYALRVLVAKMCGCEETNLVLLVSSANKMCVVCASNGYVLSALKARYGGKWIGQAWFTDNVYAADVRQTLQEILD